MQRVLVSSCLVGEPVRYDGTAASSRHPVLDRWLQERRIIPFCPEVAAGLGIPRPPVELAGGGGEAVLQGHAKAIGSTGEDLTAAFLEGALEAVALCQRWAIHVAVLQERSPTCASSCLHDGTFSGSLISGQGVTAAALRAHGVAVFSEDQWAQAQARLVELELP